MRRRYIVGAALLSGVAVALCFPLLGALLEIWIEGNPNDGLVGMGGGFLGLILAPFAGVSAAFLVYKLRAVDR